jgi:pimeloyl-ACP methyl ester carboxylesterase
LDLKGFNDSDKPILRHNYRPDVLCGELKDFLEALEVKSVTIIGHDLGGFLGWIFALKFPEIVKKLIVISAPHPNLYWNTLNVAVTNGKWCKMVQVS